MQINNAPANIPFSGFSGSPGAENIFKAVPAIDVHGKLNVGPMTFIGEYVDSTTDFDPRALTFNDRGARVSAGHVEAAYNFNWHAHPGSIAVGYGFSQDALALLLPKDRYLVTLNYAFWRDTLASLEFRHDVEYPGTDVASGAMSSNFSAPFKYENLVTAQMSVFF